MVMGRNGYGPKWLLAEITSDRQDGRADKDSYPQDGRADKDSYPQDRHKPIQYVKFMIMAIV